MLNCCNDICGFDCDHAVMGRWVYFWYIQNIFIIRYVFLNLNTVFSSEFLAVYKPIKRMSKVRQL